MKRFLPTILFFCTVVSLSNCSKSSDPAPSPSKPLVVDSTHNTVSTFAGSSGTGATDGTADVASFNHPGALALDASGNLYVADISNHLIRKITSAGVVSTLAGTAGVPGSTDGTGTAASFRSPTGVAVDAGGTVYVADQQNHLIRKVTAAGEVTTFAGAGVRGNADGTGTAAQFNAPTNLAFDLNGNLIVTDQSNNLIRKITPAGVVTTLAGSSAGYLDGTGTAAQFYGPFAIVIDAAGNMIIGDEYNYKIRKITPAGEVSTFVNSSSGFANGTDSQAKFGYFYGMALDAAGNLYLTDQTNNLIRKVTPAGLVSTYAGTKAASSVDGNGAFASFNRPMGLAIDAAGTLYVSEYNGNVIRKITVNP